MWDAPGPTFDTCGRPQGPNAGAHGVAAGMKSSRSESVANECILEGPSDHYT